MSSEPLHTAAFSFSFVIKLRWRRRPLSVLLSELSRRVLAQMHNHKEILNSIKTKAPRVGDETMVDSGDRKRLDEDYCAFRFDSFVSFSIHAARLPKIEVVFVCASG